MLLRRKPPQLSKAQLSERMLMESFRDMAAILQSGGYTSGESEGANPRANPPETLLSEKQRNARHNAVPKMQTMADFPEPSLAPLYCMHALKSLVGKRQVRTRISGVHSCGAPYGHLLRQHVSSVRRNASIRKAAQSRCRDRAECEGVQERTEDGAKRERLNQIRQSPPEHNRTVQCISPCASVTAHRCWRSYRSNALLHQQTRYLVHRFSSDKGRCSTVRLVHASKSKLLALANCSTNPQKLVKVATKPPLKAAATWTQAGVALECLELRMHAH